MGRTAALPVPAARTVERALAALLVVLLATYGVGEAANGAVPPLETAGVVAVHLAVLVGLLFPVAVVGDAAVGALRNGSERPGALTVASAAVSLAALVGSLWLSLAATPQVDPLNRALLGTAIGGTLVLVGLVLAGR